MQDQIELKIELKYIRKSKMIKTTIRRICAKFNNIMIYNKNILCNDLFNILNNNKKTNKKNDYKNFLSDVYVCGYCFKDLSYNIIIIDARKPKEYKFSHIPGSINIYFNKMHKKILYPQKIDVSKMFNSNNLNLETPIIIYCGAGLRSSLFARELKKEGFNNIRVLKGGIYEWIHQNTYLCNFNNIKENKVLPHKKFTPVIIDDNKYSYD